MVDFEKFQIENFKSIFKYLTNQSLLMDVKVNLNIYWTDYGRFGDDFVKKIYSNRSDDS